MELNEFVKDVIVSIYEGISEAKKATGKPVLPSGSLVSEAIPYVKSGIGPTVHATMISNLEFEVSLTDGTKDGVNGGIGVLLGSLTLGAKAIVKPNKHLCLKSSSIYQSNLNNHPFLVIQL